MDHNGNNRVSDGLAEQIINLPIVREKVENIVKQAADIGASGNVLWESLVFSGVVLGVEQAQQSFEAAATDNVNILRTMVGKIDTAILSCSDAESITAMNGVRQMAQKYLIERTRVLSGMFLTMVKEEYGIEAHHITDTAGPEGYSSKELVTIGFFLYRRIPSYFVAWETLQQQDMYMSMQCKCIGCVQKTIAGQVISEGDFMKVAFAKNRSMDHLFSGFAIDTIKQLREQLSNILEGTEHTPPETTEDAGVTMHKLMARYARGQ